MIDYEVAYLMLIDRIVDLNVDVLDKSIDAMSQSNFYASSTLINVSQQLLDLVNVELMNLDVSL